LQVRARYAHERSGSFQPQEFCRYSWGSDLHGELP
jgi:hypothetical protein